MLKYTTRSCEALVVVRFSIKIVSRLRRGDFWYTTILFGFLVLYDFRYPTMLFKAMHCIISFAPPARRL